MNIYRRLFRIDARNFDALLRCQGSRSPPISHTNLYGKLLKFVAMNWN